MSEVTRLCHAGKGGSYSAFSRVTYMSEQSQFSRLCSCLAYLQICCKYLRTCTRVSIFNTSNKLLINDLLTMMVMILQMSIAESISGSVNKRRTIVKSKKAVMIFFRIRLLLDHSVLVRV